MKIITEVNEKNNSMIIVSLHKEGIVGIHTKVFEPVSESKNLYLGEQNERISLTIHSAIVLKNILVKLLKPLEKKL